MGNDAEYVEFVSRIYDVVTAAMRDDSDVGFYQSLAHEVGGPLLELGCGTGRVLVPIAASGIACVGLDASSRMLARLREKQAPPTLRCVEARMESFDLGERFRLVTMPFRSFSVLAKVEEQLACLDRVRAHLAPGGLLALDLFDPKPADSTDVSALRAWERISSKDDAEQFVHDFQVDGVTLRRYDTIRRDLAEQVARVTMRFEGPAPTHAASAEFHLRWFHRFEIEHLLGRAGFGIVDVYRDFVRTPWRPGAETVVLAKVRS